MKKERKEDNYLDIVPGVNQEVSVFNKELVRRGMEIANRIEKTKKPTILCLNDDERILSFLRSEIEKKDYICITSTDSHKAFGILQEGNIDLFIQDIVRPDINGLDFFWMMKRIEEISSIPIIIVSAWQAIKEENGYKFPDDGIKKHKEILSNLDLRSNENIIDVEDYLNVPYKIHELHKKIFSIVRGKQWQIIHHLGMSFTVCWPEYKRKIPESIDVDARKAGKEFKTTGKLTIDVKVLHYVLYRYVNFVRMFGPAMESDWKFGQMIREKMKEVVTDSKSEFNLSEKLKIYFTEWYP